MPRDIFFLTAVAGSQFCIIWVLFLACFRSRRSFHDEFPSTDHILFFFLATSKGSLLYITLLVTTTTIPSSAFYPRFLQISDGVFVSHFDNLQRHSFMQRRRKNTSDTKIPFSAWCTVYRECSVVSF
jgi:hypothetical protein